MPCHISATSFPIAFLVNFLLFLTQYYCVFLEATTILANSSTLVDGSFNATCIEEERNALLEFKHGLGDPLSVLDSWVGKDCCKWDGIVCNNRTDLVPFLQFNLRSTSDVNRKSFTFGDRGPKL
ncbi:hypothetical protein M0R45_002102 [Rubus argutus]|uniref:Leucine-rich repeat-containing N-terminal plant-type domain-containing protein n=1 Tax=Rubus argutus TaxID=59490 RepID=A0AAW1VKH8_RUBAR